MVLYKKYPHSITCREIAIELGVKRQQVSDLISRWHRREFGYTKRAKVPKTKAYSYKITELGVETLLKYQKRIDEGFSLNLKIAQKEPDHIGISKLGTEQGKTVGDAIAEMKRRKETKDVDN